MQGYFPDSLIIDICANPAKNLICHTFFGEWNVTGGSADEVYSTGSAAVHISELYY